MGGSKGFPGLWHPGPLVKARFQKRLNRFVAEVEMEGTSLCVHVPNTGRMGELVIPGTDILMRQSGGKYPYRIMYFFYKGRPVLIDSIESNSIFAALLDLDRVPGMEGCRIIRREVTVGSHRFDFLIRNSDGSESLCELKSCTLAWENVASFPDAVSSRASSHVRALSETGAGRLVFLNLHDSVTTFLPNFHTDYFFSETLGACRDRLDIRAFSVDYTEDYGISGATAMEILYPAGGHRGAYFLVLENSSDCQAEWGSGQKLTLEKGYYLYGGDSEEDVFKRIEQHRRKKRGPELIDSLVQKMKVLADMPLISGRMNQVNFSTALPLGKKISCPQDDSSAGSFCLYYFRENPLQTHNLWDLVLFHRFNSFR